MHCLEYHYCLITITIIKIVIIIIIIMINMVIMIIILIIINNMIFINIIIINPTHHSGGRRAKRPPPAPTNFSSVTSTSVGVSPQNFLTFSFNSFATVVWNFKFVPSASPKLLNQNQDHPSKKGVFLVRSL